MGVQNGGDPPGLVDGRGNPLDISQSLGTRIRSAFDRLPSRNSKAVVLVAAIAAFAAVGGCTGGWVAFAASLIQASDERELSLARLQAAHDLLTAEAEGAGPATIEAMEAALATVEAASQEEQSRGSESPSPSPSITPTSSVTPSPTYSRTPTPTYTNTPKPPPTRTPTRTEGPPTNTFTPTVTPTNTFTPTVTLTNTIPPPFVEFNWNPHYGCGSGSEAIQIRGQNRGNVTVEISGFIKAQPDGGGEQTIAEVSSGTSTCDPYDWCGPIAEIAESFPDGFQGMIWGSAFVDYQDALVEEEHIAPTYLSCTN